MCPIKKRIHSLLRNKLQSSTIASSSPYPQYLYALLTLQNDFTSEILFLWRRLSQPLPKPMVQAKEIWISQKITNDIYLGFEKWIFMNSQTLGFGKPEISLNQGEIISALELKEETLLESDVFDTKTVISEELEVSTREGTEEFLETISLESSCISITSEI